jgi:hypothetical protein
MSEDVVMYQIDSETLNEIHEIVTLLREHIEWLLGRRELEAAGRLLPTMNKLNHLVISVYCGNSQEIADILTPIEQQANQFFEMWQTAPTQEEKDQLEKLFNEYSQAVEVLMQDLIKRSKEGTKH